MRDRIDRLWEQALPYAMVLVIAGISLAVVEAQTHIWERDISFHHKGALFLLPACALLAWVGFHLHVRRSATFAFSRVGDLARSRRGVVAWLAPLPRALRVVAIGLIAVALSGPHTFKPVETNVEGIDIMIVLDLSKSMEEHDLRRNRVDAAQRTIRNFLKGRKNDRIGLVVFAKQALLQCPLTLDYQAIDRIVADLGIGDVDPMGTAIGDGVGLAIGALRRADPKSSKVLILLTDGDSNVVNEMNPDESIAAAKKRDIRVFTVLMGRESDGRAPQVDLFGRQEYATNPELLKRFAKETHGKYFHAGDTEALDRGFEEVRATLEKSKHRDIQPQRIEYFQEFAAPALALVLLEIMLSLTRWRRFP